MGSFTTTHSPIENMRIDKENLAFKAAGVALLGVVMMGVARVLGPRLGGSDDTIYLAAFLTMLGGAVLFMWFWAERKGYAGAVGLGLAILGPLGALILLLLKDKAQAEGPLEAGMARRALRVDAHQDPRIPGLPGGRVALGQELAGVAVHG